MSKTKKIILASCLTVLIIGGVFILSAPPAQGEDDLGPLAAENPTANAGNSVSLFGFSFSNFFYSVIGKFAEFLFYCANIFVRVAATLLEYVSGVEKFTDVAVINTGWQICRDLANIGFVLILLVLAFDSVLQLNTYQIKAVLPRLVVAALLINFSLVFCVMIIDLSQIATQFFYQSAIGENPKGLSGQLAGALNIQKVYTEPSGDWGANLAKATNNVMSLVVGMVFGFIILLIAAFSLGAAAIYFIYRIVRLWLLMIFAPIAWIAMIVPNAPQIGSYWSKWWGDFLKWSFFAPVYMFFIYLAVSIASSAQITSDGAAAAAQSNLLKEGFISGFFNAGIYPLLQYVAVIVLLISGLQFASKASVAGSGMVMGAGAAAVGWAKRKGKQYTTDKAAGLAERGYNKAGELSAAGGAKLLGDTRFGARLRAKQTQIAEREAQRREETAGNKAYDNLLNSMSEKDLNAEALRNAGSIRSQMAMKKLSERGKIDPTTYAEFSENNKDKKLQKIIDTKLAEKRADLVALKNAQKKVASQDEEYKKELEEMREANPGLPISTEQIMISLMAQELGRLSAERLASQDWVAMKKMIDGPDRKRVAASMRQVMGTIMEDEKKNNEFQKRISPTDVNAMNTLTGVTIR